MIARVGVDIVVLLHLGFILFVVAGGFVVLKRVKLFWLHVPCVLWGIWIEFTGRICPLTPLENWLRINAGSAGYKGGFVEHYIIPVVYPVGLSRDTQFVLGIGVIVINLCIYGFVVFKYSRRKIVKG